MFVVSQESVTDYFSYNNNTPCRVFSPLLYQNASLGTAPNVSFDEAIRGRRVKKCHLKVLSRAAQDIWTAFEGQPWDENLL